MFQAEVFVEYKKDVLEPQGKTLNQAFHTLGFAEFSEARVGKYITLQIATHQKEAAENRLKELAQKLLINPNIENFRYTLKEL